MTRFEKQVKSSKVIYDRKQRSFRFNGSCVEILPPLTKDQVERKKIASMIHAPFIAANFPGSYESKNRKHLASKIVSILGNVTNLVLEAPFLLPKTQTEAEYEYSLELGYDDPNSIFWHLKNVCQGYIDRKPTWNGNLDEIMEEVRKVALDLKEYHKNITQ